MEKKVIITLIIVMLFAAVTGIILEANRMEQISRLDSKIRSLADYTGMKYLGLVDVHELSKGTGHVYYGPNIETELLHRAGFGDDVCFWTTVIDRSREVGYICRLTVYADNQDNVPIGQKKIEAEYLYGEIF